MIDKVKRFCREYAIDQNGARSAREVGYSVLAAKEVAYDILQRPEVKAYIKILIDEQAERTKITADKVLEQYRRLAFADVNDYYHYEYNLKDLSPFATEKQKNKHDRIIKYIGYNLLEAQYLAIPDTYKPYYIPNSTLKPFELLTTSQRAAIAGLSSDKYGNPILKLATKENSLNALANHLGLNIKDKPGKGASDVPATKLQIEFI